MLKNKNETIMEGLQKKYRLLIIGEMMMIVVGIMIMVGTMMLIGDNLLNERKKVELVWSNNAYLERKKRGPYLTGKTKKSTYFDKYGPSGSFTKATKGTK